MNRRPDDTEQDCHAPGGFSRAGLHAGIARIGRAFLVDRNGATALEYCFIAFLISIVAISAMTQIGVQTQANTQSILIGLTR
jgi:Flp pilus assembly pilin Flp